MCVAGETGYHTGKIEKWEHLQKVVYCADSLEQRMKLSTASLVGIFSRRTSQSVADQ